MKAPGINCRARGWWASWVAPWSCLLALACGHRQVRAPEEGPPNAEVRVPDETARRSAPAASGTSKWPPMSAAAREHYRAGASAFLRGDLEGAVTQFQRAEQVDPRAFRAAYSLGVVLQRLGRTAEALGALNRALRIVSDYEPAIVAYALLQARLGDLDGAERFLKQRRSAMPNSAALPGALAEVASLRGDSGAAQALAQEALKKNPDYRPAMVTLARDHYRSRRLDLASYTLRGILEGYGPENPPRDPRNAEAFLLRGLINEEQGNRAEAISDYRQAVTLRPDLVEARLRLGRALLESGDADEAVPLLEGAVAYDRTNRDVRLNLGDGYRLQGRAKPAREQLEWVAAKEPQSAQVQYNLGLLYLFTREFPGLSPAETADRAVRHLERYKELAGRAEGSLDADELIMRAKAKKALIEAEAQSAGSKERGEAGVNDGGGT